MFKIMMSIKHAYAVCIFSTCKVLKFNLWLKQLEWNKYVDLFVQFVSATKQFKFLLMDKHAGSVNTGKN